MEINTCRYDAHNPLLKPKSFTGSGIEYILNEKLLVIIDSDQLDSSRRKIEIPWERLGRFISELQEIEKFMG